MAFDHGILNIPISKRGNFHKELDKHLSFQRKAKKDEFDAAKASFEEAKKEAMERYKLIDNSLLLSEAHRRGINPHELRTILRDMCSDRPRNALKVLELFIS